MLTDMTDTFKSCLGNISEIHETRNQRFSLGYVFT